MLKEKILDLGFVLSESEVDELVEVLTSELDNYVSKETYEGLVEENTKLKDEVSEKDVELENLDRLREESLLKDSEHLAVVEKLKIDNAVELAINKAGGKNLKAIKALLNFENITFDENGNILGLDEQIEELLKSENSKFLFENSEVISIKGATPVSGEKTQGISKSDFEKMSYKERLEIYNRDEELYKELSL